MNDIYTTKRFAGPPPMASIPRSSIPVRPFLRWAAWVSAWVALVGSGWGSDLRVRDVRVSGNEVDLILSWSNSWRNDRNFDAAWLTLRPTREPHSGLIPLARDGHSAEGPVSSQIVVSDDGLGIFVTAARPYRGDVTWHLSLKLAQPFSGTLEAWALEMVNIPAGPFDLGDTHPELLADSSFYRVGSDGSPAGPFRVESEDAIRVGENSGQLFYQPGQEPQYRGDQQGPIPATFPKGTQSFYIMKYELGQGQYARFLNALPDAWLSSRANHQVKGEEADSCTIRRQEGRFVAGAESRPCNFISWADSAAFADWMALRPMTELEFEKAARGPRQPVPYDYPWGVATRALLRRTVTPERDLRAATALDEAPLSDVTKEQHGASFYWAMDLSGSLWERVVSAGHPRGRTFRGTHGDGKLDPQTGTATNQDWPVLSEDGRAAPGIGYRGGADYFGREGLTNPYSPVASRTFASWDGAYRYKTYSARAVRSAPQ